jgi:PAS domain S-box-containing protein
MTSINSAGQNVILDIESLESNPVPCFVTDGEARIQYFNRAMKTLFGYDEEEYVGQSVTILGKDPETTGIFSMEPGREDAYCRKGEIQAISKSGRIFPCQITIIRFFNPEEGTEVTLGLVHDMSDYSNLLTALKSRSDHLGVLASIASRTALFTDTQKLFRETLQAVSSLLPIKAGFLLLINEETGSLTFNEGFNLTQKEYDQFSSEKSWDDCLEGQVVRERSPLLIEDVSRESRAVRFVDGSMSLGLIPLQILEKVSGVISITTAVPHRLDQADMEFLLALGSYLGIYFENTRLFERLQESGFQLRRKDQDLEELLSIISHDLRSPLASIAGYASLLMKEDGDHSPDERAQFAATIFRKTKETAEMFDDLLTIFRMSPLMREDKPQPFSVRDVVQAALEKSAPSEIRDKFTISIPENLPSLSGYTTHLNYIFTNLFSNAFKFIGEQDKPTVTVSYESVDDPNGILHLFAVSDNGMGISQDYISDIFKPFFRVPKRDGIPGNGVGLAAVSRIVRNHRGTIEVKSVEGKGTTFTFTLPWKEIKDSPESPSTGSGP